VDVAERLQPRRGREIVSRDIAWMGDGAVVGAHSALKASGRIERDLLNVLLILEVDDGR